MNTMTFEDFGLPAPLAESLARMNYSTPTPIQQKSIPFALDGRDLMGSAQTGTGKTAAFCIPLIAALMNDPRACGMVMTPTRELAMQVLDVARLMIPKGSNIRTALLIGGEPMGKQFKQLNDRPRLIVGTPGRMNDHLRRQPDLFENTNFVVLDEADRMLDMGFSVQIDIILAAAPAERQTLMFSATFPAKIEKFARTYLENPQRVEIESAKVSAENITHDMIPVTQDGKYDALRAELEARMGSIIVFVKTKHGADKLAGRLQGDGHDSTPLHGGLNQRQRERATRAFRKMDFRILVATDVAARGLDIPHVEHVINYDMPMVAEDYVHRIGRTARAGAKGNALAIVSPSDRGLWMDVERVMYPDRAPAKRSHGDRDGGRSEGRKPFRKGPFNKGGFSSHRKGNSEGAGYNDRPRYNDDRPRAPRNDDQARGGFQKEGGEQRGERNYAGRTSFNDRPRGARPEGKSFADKGPRKFSGPKPEGSFDRGNDKPRGDKPFGSKPFAGKPYEGKPRSDKPYGDKPRSDKPYGDKPRGDKPYAGKPRSDKPRSDKPRGDKPYAGKPQASRRGAGRFETAGGSKAPAKSGFKKRNAA